MLKIDHFASLFRAADKKKISIPTIDVSRVLLVTDVDTEKSMNVWEDWQSFFSRDVDVDVLDGDKSKDLASIVQKVEESQCDLILSYRCLHTENWRYPYAIGSYIEVLTQLTSIPLLLLPHIEEEAIKYEPPSSVVLISDDLTQEEELLGYACAFCHKEGTITLVDLEHTAYLERILSIVGKIPQIDTDMAQEKIQEQLLKESLEWVQRSQDIISLRSSLTLHHTQISQSRMSDCIDIVEQSGAQMLVLNTKDADQLAIHGQIYPFMVQFRNIPLLLR